MMTMYLIYGNTPVKSNEPTITGDINSDGEIDILDYIALQKYIINPDSVKLDNPDINGDNKVNTADLLQLRKIIVS